MAEILGIVCNKSEAHPPGRLFTHKFCVHLDKNGIMHTITLAVKRGSLLESAICSAENNMIGRLNNWDRGKKGFNPRNCFNRCLTQTRQSLIEFMKVFQSSSFPSPFSKAVHCVLRTFKRTRQASATFLNDPTLVTRKLIGNNTRQKKNQSAIPK